MDPQYSKKVFPIRLSESGNRVGVADITILALLVILSASVTLVGGGLIPTLGMLVVAGGLFLTPGRAAILAALAITVTLLLIAALEIQAPWLRLANVAVACVLAVLVAWTMQRRTHRISDLLNLQSAVFEASPDGLAVVDTHGRLLQANSALHRLVPRARTSEELHLTLDHRLADGQLCPGDCLLDAPTGFAETITVRGESLGPRNIEYSVARIDADRVVISIRDVTETLRFAVEHEALLDTVSRQAEQFDLLRLTGAAKDLDVDVWSRPAVGQPVTGSDLVDVSTLTDGRILFLVADAMATGLDPARQAWRALYLARTLITTGTDLRDVVVRTDELLAAAGETPDCRLTALMVNPVSGELRIVSGGNLPALVVSPAGTTEWLLPRPDRSALSYLLRPGESVLLFTNGLVNGLRDSVEGMSTLRAASAALRRRQVRGWARSVLDAVLEAEDTSSTATLLLVRRADQPPAGRQTMATR